MLTKKTDFFKIDGFREVIYGNYRIVYRIIGGDDDIEILAVIHGARDMKRAFREEWELL
ncbi:MAG: type II toxin-antitoxin system RelE/ParE family toxin [Deltaproteobacteria bacterium]|nr:type II toxin-antitoxin system RelE/ParE family toxin [Deltaproteobacteria bacterium]